MSRIDPNDRAQMLWRLLHSTLIKPQAWDLVCFSAETLGLLLPTITSQDPVVLQKVKELVILIYEIDRLQGDSLPTCVPPKPELEQSSSPTQVLDLMARARELKLIK